MNSKNLYRLLIILTASLVVLCAWYQPIQDRAKAQVDAGLNRALASFATARTLSAGLSVLQGTEFSIQPLGVGVTLTLGQVLRPVNDMVEEFSILMLIASVAFGVQEVLLAVGAHWAISLLVSAFMIAWAVLHLLQKGPKWLSRVMAVVLMVRFAIPVVTLGSDLVFEHVMKEPQQRLQASLASTTEEIGKLTPQLPTTGADQKSWWDKTKEFVGSALPTFHVSYDSVKKWAANLPESLVKLLGIYLAQTIVIPIVLLWALYKVVLGVVRPAVSAT
jgi:hypothetical protein